MNGALRRPTSDKTSAIPTYRIGDFHTLIAPPFARGLETIPHSPLRLASLCLPWAETLGDPLSWHELSRVHDVGRIERLLNRPHHIESRSVLGFQKFHLTASNAVFSGRRAVHRQGAAHQPVIKGLALKNLFFITHVAKQLHMEISIPHMPDDRSEQVVFRHVPLRLHHALCQP